MARMMYLGNDILGLQKGNFFSFILIEIKKFRWTSGNPDNSGGTYFASENCIEYTAAGFNDVTCTASRKYVCETDV